MVNHLVRAFVACVQKLPQLSSVHSHREFILSLEGGEWPEGRWLKTPHNNPLNSCVLRPRNFMKHIGKKILWLVSIGSFVFFLFCLPRTLFHKPTSTVLYSNNGKLLSAIIAQDGQWRFPHNDSVPEKFKAALLVFEDKNFQHHNGVYMPSVLRAVKQNISGNEVVSGASTLSMQVVRLSRNNPPRTMKEKVLEMIRAMRLEWRYSKDEIFSFYASNAPFGGNVVGLDAAAWRYFGRQPDQLSWAEAATLAVLPNAPSLIFPGKNQEKLMQKRNRLLQLLSKEGFFDEETLELSYLEPLPQKPFPLPRHASHLLTTCIKQNGKGARYHTTIDLPLQERVTESIQRHMAQQSANAVHNAAVLVVEVRTGNVLAYVGNTTDPKNQHANMVDCIPAARSTGSILKPFLYAAMLDDGMMLPNTLVPDIPVQFEGFSPKNNAETFDGAVPASRALSRSLNVPAVLMLRDYGYPRFFHMLQQLGFSQMNESADHYGLSLILGGAEASLWDITHSYAALARTLNNYHQTNGNYPENNFELQSYLSILPQAELREEEDVMVSVSNHNKSNILSASSTWCTLRALLEVNRPETELGWEAYSSARPIAWKTGTSFGNRDAWAVGTTPEYVVGVWVGNADGVGRPELTGISSAAPLLFDVFDLLPARTWFHPPYDELEEIPVCHQSGMRVGPYCETVDSVYVQKAGLRTAPCTHHQLIHCNANCTERLNMNCATPDEMVNHSWFVLPPVQEYYYTMRHPEYLELPPFAPGCMPSEASPIGLIYPRSDARIYIPKNMEGNFERSVLEATHRDADATLFWHLDDVYLGETKTIHHLEIFPTAGKHKLTIVDQNGESLTQGIEFLEK
ncbi:MAG: penicillin-binding protein 1C [Flavobacteriales bacterium]|nr:penicillin-binding protein 1C [Flavobacteriales bacterium]